MPHEKILKRKAVKNGIEISKQIHEKTKKTHLETDSLSRKKVLWALDAEFNENQDYLEFKTRLIPKTWLKKAGLMRMKARTL
jgi:hypothetical protein